MLQREISRDERSPGHAAYRFRGFSLLPGRAVLIGPGGQDIKLRPKTFEVLQFLVESAGQLVSRDQLMRSVWRGVVVTDDSLTQCIAEIRRALGEAGGQLLQTVPKRGYMLAADVEVERPTAAPPEMAGQGVVAVGGSALALPDRPSLVVLPFANLGGDPEQAYFADGVTEEITLALSRVPLLFVIDRSSAFTLKGRVQDVRSVGRRFGVRYVLEGTVRKADGAIRIGCQLIDAESRRHLWSRRFEGSGAEVFKLQDEVAESVAAAIEPSVQAAEIERIRHKPSSSLDAYDLYLRALPHVRATTRESSAEALSLLRRAAALDPGFALAKALAGFTQANRYEQGWCEPGDQDEGLRLAREAVESGGDDAMALALAGRTFGYLGLDRDRAVAVAERALALNPNSAFVLAVAGWAANYEGRFEAALGWFRRAVRLNPMDPEMGYCFSGLAYAHLMAGECEAALEAGSRAVRAKPSRSTPHRAVIAALYRLGRTDELAQAAAAYRQAVPAGSRVLARNVSLRFAHPGLVETLISALRAAGLPE